MENILTAAFAGFCVGFGVSAWIFLFCEGDK